MTTVSIFEAKTNLSKYVASLAERKEPFIVITRNGKPAAKLIPYEAAIGLTSTVVSVIMYLVLH